jgi:hypothetical protein
VEDDQQEEVNKNKEKSAKSSKNRLKNECELASREPRKREDEDKKERGQ